MAEITFPPNRSGYTIMPSGYKRWTCMFCGTDNSGEDGNPGVYYCSCCKCASNIEDFYRKEWTIRVEDY